jgi:hypothetical protein
MIYKSNIPIPIFITGIERSGSSLIGRIVNMCGAFSGRTTTMCENISLKAITDTYYKQVGVDTRGQFPMPDTQQMLIPANWKDTVTEELSKEGYSGQEPWMYKGSRIAQIWPVWNYAYPNAKWIIVRRRTGDVITSCLKTGFMNAYADKQIQKVIGVSDEKEGWLWWVHEHEKLFVEMIETGLNVKVIWPERMVDGNFEQIHEMLEWLNLPWNPGIISLLNYTLIKDKK